MVQGSEYTFKQLQEFLVKHDETNVFLIVMNKLYKETAIMHVFLENFCGDWQSGDGVLFYSDGGANSADDDDEFILMSINNF